MKQVNYIPEVHIEAATLRLLSSYGQKYGEVRHPAVPVEEILECHLELDLRFEDLSTLLGESDVLGATWIRDRSVKIDQSLDPTVDPFTEGRYRFTVSHEMGHWELHRRLFQGNPDQVSMFKGDAEPIVCRSGSRDSIEWQADYFAGHLLMPKHMVFRLWQAVHGRLEPYVAVDEIADLNARWGLGPDDRPTVQVSRDMAREFKVSGQAMQIRLIQLGLIRTRVPEPDLFGGRM